MEEAIWYKISFELEIDGEVLKFAMKVTDREPEAPGSDDYDLLTENYREDGHDMSLKFDPDAFSVPYTGESRGISGSFLSSMRFNFW